MSDREQNQGTTRIVWFVKILDRLRSRGLDLAAIPLTVDVVRAVIATGEEITNEELAAEGRDPMPDLDDNSAEVFELLEDSEIPVGGLARVEAIIEADETVAFRHFFETTAESEATTWCQYMNRANARGELGRFAEAFEDYAVAESLAERQRDRDMISGNRQRLLVRILEERDWE